MSNVCILTDSTAQFPFPTFRGNDRVSILPFHIQLDNGPLLDGRDLKLAALPPSAANGIRPWVIPPTQEEFSQAFLSLSRRYTDIVTILLSSHLSPALSNAQKAVEATRSPAHVHLIDSQTTSVGLGLLVQAAADAAQQGIGGAQINRMVRGLVPHVYTLFCVQSLSYLAYAGQLDIAQAIIGEMLGVTPFFILENGRLTPIQKARNSRHLVDMLHEFVVEFERLKHIAIIQGITPFDQEARVLRERLNGNCRAACCSEHSLSPSLASILGPRSLGVVVMEPYQSEL